MPYANLPESDWPKMDDCVTKVMAEGHDKESAIAICHSSISGKEVSNKMTLAPSLFDLLNSQVTKERYANAAYSSLASWADKQAFFGLTKWADAASKEELEHAQIFIDYLRDRAEVKLEVVPAPPADFGDYANALQAALTLEQQVSAINVRQLTRNCS